MTKQSALRYQRLLSAVYDSALEPDFGKLIVHEAIACTGATGGGLLHLDAQSRYDSQTYSTFYTEATLEKYRAYYSAINPVLPLVTADWQPGDVAMSENYLAVRDYRNTEFYWDYVRPMGYLYEMGSLVEQSDAFGSVLFLGKAAGKGTFASDDVDLVRRVTPHLQRVMALRRRLEQPLFDALAIDFLSHEGWIVLDGVGKVLRAEGRTVDQLQAMGQLRLLQGQLAWASPRARAMFQSLLALALADPDSRSSIRRITFADSQGRSVVSLTVEVEAFRHRPVHARKAGQQLVSFVLRDITAQERAKVGAFAREAGLTPSEESVVSMLFDGHSTRAAAERLGISLETCRSHIKSAYAKSGVHSRTALAARINDRSDHVQG